MTKPIINLRCKGTLLGQGTVFIKKEKRDDGTEVNILFERKGLGTVKELIKNIFRHKDKVSLSAEDWTRNLIDITSNKKGYSTGYLIKLNPLIKNISNATNTTSASFFKEFVFSMSHEEKIPEIF